MKRQKFLKIMFNCLNCFVEGPEIIDCNFCEGTFAYYKVKWQNFPIDLGLGLSIMYTHEDGIVIINMVFYILTFQDREDIREFERVKESADANKILAQPELADEYFLEEDLDDFPVGADFEV